MSKEVKVLFNPDGGVLYDPTEEKVLTQTKTEPCTHKLRFDFWLDSTEVVFGGSSGGLFNYAAWEMWPEYTNDYDGSPAFVMDDPNGDNYTIHFDPDTVADTWHTLELILVSDGTDITYTWSVDGEEAPPVVIPGEYVGDDVRDLEVGNINPFGSIAHRSIRNIKILSNDPVDDDGGGGPLYTVFSYPPDLFDSTTGSVTLTGTEVRIDNDTTSGPGDRAKVTTIAMEMLCCCDDSPLDGISTATLRVQITGGGCPSPGCYEVAFDETLTWTRTTAYQDDGSLSVGSKYTIMRYNGSDDFTNVGAASNARGVNFVATGTTPADWSSRSILLLLSIEANEFQFLCRSIPGGQGRRAVISRVGFDSGPLGLGVFTDTSFSMCKYTHPGVSCCEDGSGLFTPGASVQNFVEIGVAFADSKEFSPGVFTQSDCGFFGALPNISTAGFTCLNIGAAQIDYGSLQDQDYLNIGRTYVIVDYTSGDDFTNVGAASNTTGEVFVATGRIPADWSHHSAVASYALVTGITYVITSYVSGDDFTNVGGTNVTGSVFTATGTTPASWFNGSQVRQLVNGQTSGALIVGTIRYRIISYQSGDDFTNIGGANVTGNIFIPTGSTPANWSHGSTLVPEFTTCSDIFGEGLPTDDIAFEDVLGTHTYTDTFTSPASRVYYITYTLTFS